MSLAGDVQILPATNFHAHLLAQRMRVADVAEVWAASRVHPLEAAVGAIQQSHEAWAVYFGRELGCVWGVVLLNESLRGGRTGCVWMLTTDTIEQHKHVFARACYAVLPLLFDRWDLLVNRVDARRKKVLRWGRRLGFQFNPPTPFGPDGRDFCFFRVTKEEYLQCVP